MPNLVMIGPTVWISIPDTHTHTHTHTNPPGFNFIYKILLNHPLDGVINPKV